MRAVGGDALKLLVGVLAIGAIVLMGVQGCGLGSERVSKGKSLYRHYCMHCHGENGRQNEGFNWIRMPDPRPKDLAAHSEMSTFTDEEIFETIYRDMKDTTPEVGDKIGDEEFAVPTMPTFKYTLSQDEIWSLVAYVRTLHSVSLTHDVDGHIAELKERYENAQKAFEAAEQALKAAEARAEAEAEAEGEEDEELEDEEEAVLPEEEALENADIEMTAAKAEFEGFTKRPRHASVSRPNLTVSARERAKLVQVGKRLYSNKYGCNGCHSLGDQGGLVGPALDRAGFRLNGTWVYRWIKYPQAMKRKTRMPNLGLSDADAKAITIYLNTLRAPKPEQPISPPA